MCFYHVKILIFRLVKPVQIICLFLITQVQLRYSNTIAWGHILLKPCQNLWCQDWLISLCTYLNFLYYFVVMTSYTTLVWNTWFRFTGLCIFAYIRLLWRSNQNIRHASKPLLLIASCDTHTFIPDLLCKAITLIKWINMRLYSRPEHNALEEREAGIG